MTSLDTTRSLPSSGTGMAGVILGVIGTLASWNDARITRKSLSRLSLRELDDIGLTRGDIDMIAARGGRL